MVNIAIPGGTGGIGQSIADVLKKNPKHKVIVLSRKTPKGQDPKVPVFTVDYSDVKALTSLLESQEIHTIISAMHVSTEEASAFEINLITAAEKAAPTKRFISSDWGISVADKSLWLPQMVLRENSREELRKTGLEWTTIRIGLIADYFGLPHVQSHMSNIIIHVDIENKMASIPGTGEDLIAYSWSTDIARFIEAALDLPQWEQEWQVFSEKVTLNQAVKWAEEARGTKFKVAYDPIEKLEKGEMTELPSHSLSHDYFPRELVRRQFSRFGVFVMKGFFNVPFEKSLNKLFPEIKTRTAREIIFEGWGGK